MNLELSKTQHKFYLLTLVLFAGAFLKFLMAPVYPRANHANPGKAAETSAPPELIIK